MQGRALEVAIFKDHYRSAIGFGRGRVSADITEAAVGTAHRCAHAHHRFIGNGLEAHLEYHRGRANLDRDAATFRTAERQGRTRLAYAQPFAPPRHRTRERPRGGGHATMCDID